MSDVLQGISFSQDDFLKLIDGIIDNKNIKGTVEVESKGFKDIAKDSAQATKGLYGFAKAWNEIANSKSGDAYVEKMKKIQEFLIDAKKFKNVNLNQFTAQILNPAQNDAEQLANSIDSVYSSITTLAKVKNATKFQFITQSDIDKIIKGQQAIDELQAKYNLSINQNRTTARNINRSVDIANIADVKKIQRERHTAISEQLGIDNSQIQLNRGDDTLLQQYKQISDVLKQMISEREQFNELNSENVEDFVTQEKNILYVFQQLQRVESDVKKRFDIDPSNLFSAQFKGANKYRSNVSIAVEQYAEQMTADIAKELQEEKEKFDQQILRIISKSPKRVENANASIAKERTGKTGGLESQAGEQIGSGVESGMERAATATDSATESIEKYILSADDTINKLKELRDELINLDNEYSNKFDSKSEKQIQEKSAESLKYIANLQRLGYSDEQIGNILGKDLGDNDTFHYIKAFGKTDSVKQTMEEIKSYVQSTPIEVPVEVSEEKIEETKSSIQVLLEYLNQLNTAKPDALVNGFQQLSPSIKKAIEDLGLLNKEKNGLNLVTTGNTNNGAIVGEQNTLISRNGTQEKYEEALRLKNALDQAAQAGVNVSRILDVAFDSSKNTILELQETASGELISNIPAFGESTDNMKFNEALLQATDEQIIKLIKDIETLNNLGINIDFTDSNFLYDKQKGFSIIDLALKGENSSDYGKEELLDMFDFIRSEFEDAGKDTGAIDAFVERINTAINLKKELEKPGGGNAGVVNTSQAEQDIGALKNELQSLQERLQRFKEIGVEPEGIAELQKELEVTKQRADSLSNALYELTNDTIDVREYERLEEELQQANNTVVELKQQLSELQEVKQQRATTPTTSVLSAKDFYEKYGTPSQALDSSSFGGDYDTLFSYLGDKFKELRENVASFSEQQLDFEFLKELVSQLDLSDEKLKVIQANFERISERLPGGNAAFEPEEMKTEEIASRLKDIVAIIDGTKIISPEDLSNAESILRYAKEYRQEMSKPSGTIQEQREEPQQVDTSSDQASEQADIQAAEAAEQRAQANEHLAESEQKVDEAESANNGTPNVQDVNQAMLGEQSTVDQTVDAETSKFDELKNKIAVDIPAAITTKNEAFKEEQGIVEGVVQAEIDKLSQLESALDGIANAAKNKSEAFRSSEKTSGDQSNQTGEKKTKEKSKEQIRDEHDAQLIKDYNVALAEYIKLEQQRVSLVKQGNVTLSDQQMASQAAAFGKMASIQEEWNKETEHSNKLQEEFNGLLQKRSSEEQRLNTEYVSNFNAKLKKDIKYSGRMTTYNTLLNEQALRPDAFSGAMEEMKKKAEELQSYFPINPTDDASIKRVHELSDEMEQMVKEIRSNPEYKNATDTAQAALSKKAETWAAKNTAAINADPEGFERIRQAIRDINTLSEQNEASNMLDQFIAKSNEAGKAGMSFVDVVKKRFVSLGAYLASFASFYRIIGWAKQAIQVVTELDTAMMELKKVSNESAKSYSDFLKGSFDQADVVGGNAKQIIESTAAWKRLGKTFEESQEAAQASVKLLNVSEFDNIDDATTSLISMRQAFKDNTYDDFIDKLNGVGDSFSSSTDQIAYGMRNISAVLKVAGNDIDQSIALLTAANDITQDMSKASMGVRTIALRISGTQEAKQELEDLGEDVSDFVVQTQSKVDAQVRKFTATAANPNGISVLDETGRLRDTYDILLDISRVYQDIVDKDNQMGTNTSNALLELLAGKTRSNILASILQNPDLLEQAYETSKNSQGVGQRELDIYLDSIQAKTTQLQNRVQELISTAVSSDFIKTAVEGLTKLVELANTLVKTLGALPTVMGAVSGFFLQKNGKGINNLPKIASDIGTKIRGVFNKEFGEGMSDELKKNFELLGGIGDSIDADIGLKDIIEVNGGIENMSAELQTYVSTLKESRYATITLGEAVKDNTSIFSGFGGVISKVTTIGKTLLSTIGTMALTMVASAAIGAGIKLLTDYIRREEIAIEKGKEARQNVDDITKSYQKQKDVVDSFDSKEYASLSKKNSAGIISTEEYEKFVSINNELADIFPELVSSYDEQGNAILTLGDNADIASAQLENLLNQEKKIAQYNINEELGTAINGMFISVDRISRDIVKQDDIISLYSDFEDIASSMSEGNLFNFEVDTEDTNLKSLISQAQDLFRQAVYNNGGWFSEDLHDEYRNEEGKIVARYSLIPEFEVGSEGNLNDAINEYQRLLKENGIDVTGATSEAKMKRTSDIREIKAEWNSIVPSLIGQMGLYEEFEKIPEQAQQSIRDAISSLDITKLAEGDRTSLIEDPRAFVRGMFLDPIWNAISDSQGEIDEAKSKVFEDLLNIDSQSLTNKEYQDSVNSFISQLSEDEEIQKQIRIILGISFEDEDGNEVWDVDKQSQRIYDYFGVDKKSKSSKSMLAVKDIEAFSQEQKNALEEMISSENVQFDPMKIMPTELFNRIDQWIAKKKEVNKIEPTDTLSDLFNNEEYSDSASKFESNLSSLTGALETLRSEGSLTAEQMVELQNSFPDLTEFTTNAIQTKAFEELDEWIQKIREGMKDMSDDGKKQARTMIQNMVDQYGDLGISIDTLRTKYVEESGVKDKQFKDEVASEFDAQVEQLKSDLAAEGLELDTHVLYTLVAQDEFSGKAEEILAKYKDISFNWEINLENEQLEKDIEHQQNIISNEQGKRAKKEAQGKLIESSDYNVEIESLDKIVSDRQQEAENAWEKWRKQSVNSSADQVAKDALKEAAIAADTAVYEAESDVLETRKQRAESGANDLLRTLKDNDNDISRIQNQITEAEKGDGKADQELYDELAAAQENRSKTNQDLYNFFMGLANSTKNKEWKQEWTDTALGYQSSSNSDEADALESRNIPLQTEYNELQSESEQIQREITVAAQKHQKVSKKTYSDLISNGIKQISNLKKQQSELDEYSEGWWKLQNSIDSMNDSIYDWSSSMDTLIYDQASQLASTISTAMSEQFSETGLTTDTINALLTGFSDLTGKKLDVSDAFYNTADGVKVNTQALQELTEAEFELQAASITSEIERTQAALDQNPGDSALQQKLQKLMQTQAQYFAQYEEMQKALSYNNAIDLAEGTENAGANYDKNYGRVKTYKEAREKGLIGTDDFKAWTSYLDVYGRDTIEAYDAVSSKIDRYFTEDASDGLTNFLTDMEKLGYAAQDADGYWTLAVDDYDAAAKDMQMGSEWFMDTLTKLEDFGMVHTYVSSLTEAQLKAQDAEEQIAEAMQTYGEMVRRGASEEDLQKQIDHIHELEDAWNDVNTVRETWSETSEANKRADFLGLEDQLAAAQKMYEQADTDAGRKAAKELAQSYVDQWNYTLGEGADEGIFKLSEASAADYIKRTSITGDSFDQIRDSIGETMSKLGEGGNVNLLARPFVDAARLVEAGWEDAGDGIATVFSSTFSTEDEKLAMNFTPILPDGSIMERGKFEQYCQDVVNGVRTDDMNLQIGAEFTGDDAIEKAVADAERIHELQDEYYFGIDDFKQYYQNNTEQANEYLSVLSKVPTETLEKISLSNGGYEVDKDIEDSFQGLADALGYTNENAYQLLDILGLIGESVKLPSQYEELENLLSTTTKGSGAGYQISTDLASQSLDSLNTQMEEIGTLKVQLDPNSEVYSQLEQLEQDTQLEIDARLQQDITDSGVSTTQYKAWAAAGDNESIAKSLGIEVDSSELDQYLQQINSMPDSFDMAVHIDDEQFTQLVSAITEPWSMLINADTSEAEQQTEDFKQKTEKTPIIQTIQQKIQNFGNAVAGFLSGQKVEATTAVDNSGLKEGTKQAQNAVKDVGKTKGTASVDVDTSQANNKLSQLRVNLLSIAAIRPSVSVDSSGIGSAISRTQDLINGLRQAIALKSQASALGTAHALGTLSRAYSSGSQDWTVGRNESALVNEIGQESRVRDGVWELIPGGPHVEDLKKDDIIN